MGKKWLVHFYPKGHCAMSLLLTHPPQGGNESKYELQQAGSSASPADTRVNKIYPLIRTTERMEIKYLFDQHVRKDSRDGKAVVKDTREYGKASVGH